MKVFGARSLRLGNIFDRIILILNQLRLTHFLLGVDSVKSIVVQNCRLDDERLLGGNLLHLGGLPQFGSLGDELNVLYLEFRYRLIWTFSLCTAIRVARNGCCNTIISRPYFPHAVVLGDILLVLFLSDLDFLLHDVEFLGLSVLILCFGYAQIGVPHVERLHEVID